MAIYGNPISTHEVNPSGGGQLDIALEGEGWNTMAKFLKYVGDRGGRALKRDIAKASRDFLTRYKSLLIKGLLSEGNAVGANWPPHSPNYKSPTGWLLYRTGHYQTALQNLQIKQKAYDVSLVFNPSDLHRKSVKHGLTLGQYVVVNEYGSLHIPARPLWGPAFNKMGGPKGFRDRVFGAVGKRLSKLGIR